MLTNAMRVLTYAMRMLTYACGEEGVGGEYADVCYACADVCYAYADVCMRKVWEEGSTLNPKYRKPKCDMIVDPQVYSITRCCSAVAALLQLCCSSYIHCLYSLQLHQGACLDVPQNTTHLSACLDMLRKEAYTSVPQPALPMHT